MTITGGVGGSADSKTGGEGGSVVITPGAAGETTEIEGGLYLRGATSMPVFFKTTVAAAAKTTDTTLTVAEVFGGILVVDDGGGATSSHALPTGTAMTAAAPPNIAAGDSFYFHVINEGTTAAELAVITAGADFTIQGSGTIEELDAAINPSSGMFLIRFVTGNTWTCTRVA